MPPVSYQIFKCQRVGCGLRYPVVEGQPFTERCPRCRGSTRLVYNRSLEQELWDQRRTSPTSSFPDQSSPLIHALLDNIRSAWNVGSMFRSADGAGICHMYLCGITPTPEIAAVGKTALGAEESTRWDYASNGVFRAEELLKQGCRLWALEQDRRSISITDLDLPADGGKPLILVVGNEVCGVDPGILERCEQIVHIPMQGGKRSLNVAVAFGIAAFALRELKNPGRS